LQRKFPLKLVRLESLFPSAKIALIKSVSIYI
jgi:hypothetical protein